MVGVKSRVKKSLLRVGGVKSRVKKSLFRDVEMAAVYESLPAVFLNDTTGRKQQVRVKLENDIYKLLEERNKQPSSSADKFRNRVYQSCPPPFAEEKLFGEIDSNDNTK